MSLFRLSLLPRYLEVSQKRLSETEATYNSNSDICHAMHSLYFAPHSSQPRFGFKTKTGKVKFKFRITIIDWDIDTEMHTIPSRKLFVLIVLLTTLILQNGPNFALAQGGQQNNQNNQTNHQQNNSTSSPQSSNNTTSNNRTSTAGQNGEWIYEKCS